ncbi:MAG: pseudouridine synthase [Elusimicrobia bacterium]|nr:pseudouridine synthase [Elusimicrobiota bacterium]MDE2314585.1 pseudouridine synthase [Elusimicrobiota bacterium]
MTILFHKPYGVVSQFTPLGGKKTLAAFDLPKGIYPCGRLDHDSEGLLILSDDGRLQSRLCEPRFAVPRTYWAQVERVPDAATISHIRKGLVLRDGPTRPCEVRILEKEPARFPRVPPVRLRKNAPTAWLEITLTEGRNRQLRRMTAAVGHPTLRLIRASHGRFSLGALAPGQWRRAEAAQAT